MQWCIQYILLWFVQSVLLVLLIRCHFASVQLHSVNKCHRMSMSFKCRCHSHEWEGCFYVFLKWVSSLHIFHVFHRTVSSFRRTRSSRKASEVADADVVICSYRLLYSQIYLKRRQEGSDGCQTDVRRSEGQDSKGSRIASKLHVFHEIPEWYVFPIPKLHETLVFLSLERSLGDLQPQYFGHIAYSSFWFDAWWAHLRAVKLTLGDKDQLKSDLRKKVCHDFELSMHEIMCVYILYIQIYT